MEINVTGKFLHQTSDNYPWRKLNLDLSEINPIPSMITPDESFYLHWLAREYYEGLGEIIDGGPLLGGSTLALASGLEQNQQVTNKHKRIHSYDIFTYHESYPSFLALPSKLKERDSLKSFSNLKNGESLQPFFEQNTEKYKDYIELTAGDILQSRWSGQPIEILFIDLAKSWEINNHVIKEFFGCLIPNRSIVVHQDYFHHYCYWIHLTMHYFSPYFQAIHTPDGGIFAFMLTKEIPPGLLDIDYSTYFTKQQAIELMDVAIAPLQGIRRLSVIITKIHLLAILKEYNAARTLAREVRASSDYNNNWLRVELESAERNIPADEGYIDFNLLDRVKNLQTQFDQYRLETERQITLLRSLLDRTTQEHQNQIKNLQTQFDQYRLETEGQITVLRSSPDNMTKEQQKQSNQSPPNFSVTDSPKESQSLSPLRVVYHHLIPLKIRLQLRKIRVQLVGW